MTFQMFFRKTIFMMFIVYNRISTFNWGVFSWNFFPTVKTKPLNVLGFLR